MPSQAQWLSRLDPPTFLPIYKDSPSHATYVNVDIQCYKANMHFSVRHRPHQIDVSLSHPTPAYLDEEYPVTISVTNVDDHDLSIVVDILLQPAEDDTGMFIMSSMSNIF